MKHIKHWLATMAVLLCCITASSQTFEVEGLQYTILSFTEMTVSVKKGNNDPIGDLVIPATVTYGEETFRVTSIEKRAFSNCNSLTSINIPESVTSIEQYAFSGCTGELTINCNIPSASSGVDSWFYRNLFSKVFLGAKVTSIGDYAFYGSSELAFISIPEGVKMIGNSAFFNCISLATINIPQSVTSIGSKAFWGCNGLISINIPENVTLVGSRAFCGCTGELLVNCNIPSVSSSVDSWFFQNEFNKVSIGAKVTSIGDYAFYGSSDLVSVNIPESVTTIGSAAFRYCSSLKSVTIPYGVTSIADHAFMGCSSLTSIIIPESVSSIGRYSFSSCNSLTSISIPESVTSIEHYAFSGTPWLNEQPDGVVYIGNVLYIYKGAMPENTSIEVREGTVSISSEAFQGQTNLSSITLSKDVISIGYRAFYDCTGLIIPTIPKDSKLVSIGNSAFSGCSNLISITIPESVMSIGDYAFHSCRNLTSIILSRNSSLALIGDGAFWSTPWLDDQPDGVVYIGNVLYKFKGLMPENTSIDIKEGTISVVAGAFMDCDRLISIIIPKSVTLIGEGAFDDCISLTSITCKADNAPQAKNSIFNGVDKSIPVYVPASSVSVYQSADYWNEFSNIQIMPETITINQYGSGTYCSEYALDFSEVDGLKAYAATGYNTKTGIVTLTRVMTSQPGMGLFLKGEEGEYIVPVLESTDDNSLNMLVGTLGITTINGVSDDGLYYNYRYTIKDGDEAPLFYRVDDGYTLSAGKAYLQIPVAWMPAEAKSISLRFDDEDGMTDIEEMKSANQNAEVIYDLLGRKVSKPQEGGVYIVNGKKMVW